MTTFLLIRHGHCEPVGKYIAGRKSGIHLSETGNMEVRNLVKKLEKIKISAIFSSPLERAMETAIPISKSKGIDISIKEEVNEIDYGQWTGKSIEELSADSEWKLFNQQKGRIRVPGGEAMVEVVSRMSLIIEKLRRSFEGNVIIVSHGDPIKSVISHYAGVPLDFMNHFDIQPASISTMAIDDYGAKILSINI